MLDLLVAIEDPSSGSKLRRALVTPLTACPAAELAIDTAGDGSESAELAAWADRIRRWNDLWQRGGFIQMMRDVLDGDGRRGRLLSEVGGERRLTNLLHLTELLHAQSRAERLGPAGLVHWLQQQIAAEDRTVEEHLVRLESDFSVVQVTTMHRAKGLEYGIVYCPYLLGNVHDHVVFHRDGELVYDVRSKRELRPDQTVRAQQFEALSEDLRLLYVALTRAVHRVIVLTTEPESTKSAWCYLLDRPDLETARQPLDALGKKKDVLARIPAKLADWCAGSGGAIRARTMGEIPDRKWTSSLAGTTELVARSAPREIGERSRRRSSFTALVAGAEIAREPSAAEVELLGATDSVVADVTAGVAAGVRVLLADFPRGTRAGLAVHEVFERMHELGFDSVAHGDQEIMMPPIERELRRYGIDPAEHSATLQTAVVRTLTAEFAPDVRLRDVFGAHREAEVEFHVPIGTIDPATAEGLAAAMTVSADSAIAGEGLSEHYLESLERLQFKELRGYLRGFIDWSSPTTSATTCSTGRAITSAS